MSATARWVLALAVIVLAAAPALGGVERVTLHVKGMQCPFCTYNVEKRIKGLDAVPADPHWEASVEEGLVRFDWKPGTPFEAHAVRQAVKKAGFTPGPMEVTARGTARAPKTKTKDGGLRLSEEKGDWHLKLVTADRLDRKRSFEALRAFIGEAEKPTVSIHGRVAGEEATKVRLWRWHPRAFGGKVVMSVKKLVCEQCSAKAMKGLRELEGVIHAEADHAADRVHVWTHAASPDIERLRGAVRDAGFEVKHVHDLSSKS